MYVLTCCAFCISLAFSAVPSALELPLSGCAAAGVEGAVGEAFEVEEVCAAEFWFVLAGEALSCGAALVVFCVCPWLCVMVFAEASSEAWVLLACPHPARSPKRQSEPARSAVSFTIFERQTFIILLPFMTSPFPI